LLARWEEDVASLSPDWISVMIGINDIWRQMDSPCQTESHVQPEEYAANIEELLRRCAAGNIRAALISPFFVEPRRDDEMRKMCDRYAGICRELAQKHGALFVDAQAAFDRWLEHNNSMRMTWDRGHPNLTGHLLIAKPFCRRWAYNAYIQAKCNLPERSPAARQRQVGRDGIRRRNERNNPARRFHVLVGRAIAPQQPRGHPGAHPPPA
jgi:hypothetical protein